MNEEKQQRLCPRCGGRGKVRNGNEVACACCGVVFKYNW